MKSIFNYVVLGLLLGACDDMLLPDAPANDPVSNFETLWSDYEVLYGSFAVKNIDWDDVYTTYRPQISDESTNQELYTVFTEMLDILNDNHVFLYPTDSRLASYNSGITGRMKTFTDFKMDVVKTRYLDQPKQHNESILSGFINDSIGYIHFSNFNESQGIYKNLMPELLAKFKNTKGLILDVRANEGGRDQASVQVAGHFTDKAVNAFRFRIKNGPKKDDFTDWNYYKLEKETDKPYLKPIVLLTHRFTISAAETFVLSMSELPQVIILGDTTSGAFSDVIRRELPNGWAYGISVGQWTDAHDHNWEGTGFPPDQVIQNTPEELTSGLDKTLTQAISILQNP